MRFKLSGAAAVALAVVCASAAQAQSIDPASFSATLAVGESVTIHKTITLAAGGADLVDLYMLADNTGSMGTTIGQAKAGATAILGALPTNTFVGIGDYQGDCYEGGLAAGCREEVTTFYGTGERRRCRATCRPLRPASTDGPPGTAVTIPRPASTHCA